MTTYDIPPAPMFIFLVLLFIFTVVFLNKCLPGEKDES